MWELDIFFVDDCPDNYCRQLNQKRDIIIIIIIIIIVINIIIIIIIINIIIISRTS